MPTITTSASALEFAFTWDLREYVRLHPAVIRNRRRLAWERVAIWVYWGIVLLGVGTLAFQILRGRPSVIVALLPWLAMVLFWPAFLRWGTPWIAARTQQKHLGGAGASLSLRVDETGVTSAAEKGETTFKWPAIERIVATDEFLLFYFTHNCALYLPRRAVPSEVGWEAVRSSVTEQNRDRGGVLDERRRRRRTLAVAAGSALVIGGVLLLTRWLPPVNVVSGEEIRPSYLRFLESEGLLQPGEEVLLFYSGSDWSIKSDINLLTTRGIVSYSEGDGGVYREVVPFEKILRVDLYRGRSRSTIEVTTTKGDEVVLYAPSRQDGDQFFTDRIKEEWRSRVPVGMEEPEPSTGVDLSYGPVS
jgi:hypothetical protein